MSYQLIYTSAEELLDPGLTGYGVVACSVGISPQLKDRLIALSDVHEAEGAEDSEEWFAYRVCVCGGDTFHVLSRYGWAGADYSNRKRSLAHHLALTADEVAALKRNAARPTPAGIMLALRKNRFWVESWEGPPRELEGEPRLTSSSLPDASRQVTWKTCTGHKNNARAFFTPPYDGACLVEMPPGSDASTVLLLLNESDWLSTSRGWGKSFSSRTDAGSNLRETERLFGVPGSMLREMRLRHAETPFLRISPEMALPRLPEVASDSSSDPSSGARPEVGDPPSTPPLAPATGGLPGCHIPYKYCERPDEETYPGCRRQRRSLLRFVLIPGCAVLLAAALLYHSGHQEVPHSRPASPPAPVVPRGDAPQKLLRHLLTSPYSAAATARQLDKIQAKLKKTADAPGGESAHREALRECVSILQHASSDSSGHAGNLFSLRECAGLLSLDVRALCELYMNEALHDRSLEEWQTALDEEEYQGWAALLAQAPEMESWLSQEPFLPYMEGIFSRLALRSEEDGGGASPAREFSPSPLPSRGNPPSPSLTPAIPPSAHSGEFPPSSVPPAEISSSSANPGESPSSLLPEGTPADEKRSVGHLSDGARTADNQAVQNQPADKQTADNQAAEHQLIPHQPASNQPVPNQAVPNQAADKQTTEKQPAVTVEEEPPLMVGMPLPSHLREALAAAPVVLQTGVCDLFLLPADKGQPRHYRCHPGEEGTKLTLLPLAEELYALQAEPAAGFPPVTIRLKDGVLQEITSEGTPAILRFTLPLQPGRAGTLTLVSPWKLTLRPMGEGAPPTTDRVDFSLPPERLILTPTEQGVSLRLKPGKDFPWTPLLSVLQLRPSPTLLYLPVLDGANVPLPLRQETHQLPYNWLAEGDPSRSSPTMDAYICSMRRVYDFAQPLMRRFHEVANLSCCGEVPGGDAFFSLANVYSLVSLLDDGQLSRSQREGLGRKYIRLFTHPRFARQLGDLFRARPQLLLTPHQAEGNGKAALQHRRKVHEALAVPENRRFLLERVREFLSLSLAETYERERQMPPPEGAGEMQLLLHHLDRSPQGELLWFFSLQPLAPSR